MADESSQTRTSGAMLAYRFFPDPFPSLLDRFRPFRSGFDGQPSGEDSGPKGPRHPFASERFQISGCIADEKQPMVGSAIRLTSQRGGSMPWRHLVQYLCLYPSLQQNSADQCFG
jgi:hypothetical protein